MQNHPKLLLLRRPLPPKLSKLPLHKKKVHTANTGKTLHVKFAQEGTALIQRDETSFPDVVSRNESQTFITIQNLSLDHDVQERVSTVSTSPKPLKNVYWKIPKTATGCIFFPSCFSASGRVFGKETNQVESLRKSKKPSKLKNISVENMLKDILVLSSAFSKPSHAPSSVITPNLKEVLHSEYLLLPKSEIYTFKRPLTDLSSTRSRPLPRIMPVQAKTQPSHHLQQNINHFPSIIFMPAPVLPRKPRRQSEIENSIIGNENLESVPRQSMPTIREGFIKTRKRDESEANVIRGDGFKTVAATRYETITAMTNLAIINCQMYGRNALNLMGFFILNCPDLTSLAFQLIYLNLSFNNMCSFPTEVLCLKHLQILILRNNPIKEISSEIQQLKFLRVFNIAFNLITALPPGLFCLPHLEELDISYNSIAFIPNEIQKLRSLKKLIVDGNEMTSFPSGILKLNLKKLLFKNTFTHPNFWKENSLNSPQRLTQLTSLFFFKNNLHKYYDVIPVEIQTLLNCTTRCEWCHGPKFGEGYRIIQSCNVFGTSQLPIMFHVCSASCYRKVKENSCVLDSIPG
ncbi:leucine-rich repeat-containing protein 63 isoform 1-T1 [Hipposideros larvatus]